MRASGHWRAGARSGCGPIASGTPATSSMPAPGSRRAGCSRPIRTSRRSFRSAPASIISPSIRHCRTGRRCASWIASQHTAETQTWRGRLVRARRQPAAGEVTVGVMGLGVMGRDAVDVLARLGFRLVGWSRTAKAIPGVETFHGNAGLDAFLARTEILVCLLPHTPATQGILDLTAFRKLERDGALGGAFLINAGRGALQVDDDIVAALDQGLLAGATLDVFPTETLPTASPLWAHPHVTITPHKAAESDPRALVTKVLQQIDRFEAGQPLENVIDRGAGY